MSRLVLGASVPRRTSYLAVPVIAGLVSLLYVAAYVVLALLGVPADLSLPWPVRLIGLPLLAYGVAMAAWVVRFRGPGAILESTWATLVKLIGRAPLGAAAGRTEPLVVAGPYRLVRHPLYSGVDGLTWGLAFLAAHPWAFLGALALALWFLLVLAPFEEKELCALFGPAYSEYMRRMRRFLPLPRRP